MPEATPNTETLSQRQQILVPDYLDDPTSPNSDEKIFPSFIDLKRKTLQSLYGLDKNKDYNHALLMDKSPKGSVDEKIRSMVDLINAHPSYATLSSCSGRISLFDPNHEATISSHIQIQNNDNDASTQTTEELETSDIDIGLKTEPERTSTGKGYGAWLISSHGTITPSQLISALEEQAKSNSHHSLIFKHEPLLLHVAASNLSRARQLLKLALDLGFRESGTVITPKRITVAIRSHSLALTVPIASKGRLRPNDEFIEELVREANERFELNDDKLKRLEAMIENTMFTTATDDDGNIDGMDSGDKVLDSVDFTVSHIPDLNLWGHTAVIIPTELGGSTSDAMIVASGGYGAGPNGKKKSASRSNKIHSLRRIKDQWDNKWVEMKQADCNDIQEDATFSWFRGTRCILPAREGCASCILPPSAFSLHKDQSPLVAIFGGRSSPARPSNELYLMSFKSGKMTVFSPTNVRGEVPAPRWGHSFTALSGKGGKLAILIGGRDETDLVPSVYILSCAQCVEGNSLDYHFIWERVGYDIRRFYHCSTRLNIGESGSSEDTIIIQGGLTSTALIPSMAEGKENGSTDMYFTLSIAESGCDMKELKGATNWMFGASTCSLSAFNSSNSHSYVFTSGGLLCKTTGEKTPAALQAMKCYHDDGKSSVEMLETNTNHALDQGVNFGSMVHHSCLELPPRDRGMAEVVIIGGGVPAFAFGQSYAR